MDFYRVARKIYKPGEFIWETGEGEEYKDSQACVIFMMRLVSSKSEQKIQDYLSIDQRWNTPYIEAILELTRKEKFSNLPVRFKNMHVFKDLASAKLFRDSYRSENNKKIYKLKVPECSQYFTGDMNIYTYFQPPLNEQKIVDASIKYWSGELGSTPFEEVILYPNTKVSIEEEI